MPSNDWKLTQEGSPTRDRFKLLHKRKLPRDCYALNSDLELVDKYPVPGIVARLDFKCLNDSISFTEGIAYNHYVSMGIPVYLVEAQHQSWEFTDMDPDVQRFCVYQYIEANWKPDPPIVTKVLVAADLSWADLSNWEKRLRRERRHRLSQPKSAARQQRI